MTPGSRGKRHRCVRSGKVFHAATSQIQSHVTVTVTDRTHTRTHACTRRNTDDDTTDDHHGHRRAEARGHAGACPSARRRSSDRHDEPTDDALRARHVHAHHRDIPDDTDDVRDVRDIILRQPTLTLTLCSRGDCSQTSGIRSERETSRRRPSPSMPTLRHRWTACSARTEPCGAVRRRGSPATRRTRRRGLGRTACDVEEGAETSCGS